MVAQPTLSKEQIKEIADSVKATPPNDIEKFFISTLKYTPEQFKSLSQLAGTIQSIAKTAGEISGYIDTAVKILEKLGLLEAEDPMQGVRDFIQSRHANLLEYYSQSEAQAQREFRAECDTRTAAARSAMADLKVARSRTIFASAEDSLKRLSEIIYFMTQSAYDEELVMNAPVKGNVAFTARAYGLPPLPGKVEVPPVPDHWLYFASADLMKTSGGRAVGYREPDAEVTARIWDPGYYIDALSECVVHFLSLLTLMEPAFQATGYKRAELLEIGARLEIFVEAWRNALLFTQIEPLFSGPAELPLISPRPVTFVRKPYLFGGIPLGVIDPVTGIAIFESQWLGPMHVVGEQSSSSLIDNGAETMEAAKAEISARLKAIEFLCGIVALDGLATNVRRLADYGYSGRPSKPGHIRGGSLFTEIGHLKKYYEIVRHETLAQPGATIDTIDPHLLDDTIVVPTESDLINLDGEPVFHGDFTRKSYQFEWKDAAPGFEFTVPIVRRMDATGIQIGYKLLFSIGSDSANSVEIELATFSAPLSHYMDDEAPIFPVAPEGTIKHSIHDANLFDVIQDRAFDDEEEEAYPTGRAMSTPVRLLVGREVGTASISISVSHEFDASNPQFSFVGKARIFVRNQYSDNNKAFVVSVRLLETARAYHGGMSGEAAEIGVLENIVSGSANVLCLKAYKQPEKKFFDDRLLSIVTTLPDFDH